MKTIELLLQEERILINEKLTQSGIKWIILDVDSTLVDTVSWFNQHMGKYSEAIASMSGTDVDAVSNFMGETLSGLRSEFSAHPSLMKETARITALRYGIDFYHGDIKRLTDELMEIYSGAPEAFDGVYEALCILHSCKPIALWTLADDLNGHPWTDRKMAVNGLQNKYDMVFNEPSWSQKDSNSLRRVLKTLGVTPQEVLVIGDSWSSDVRPALECGVPHQNIFRIKTDYNEANKGRHPGITEVSSFSDIPRVLISNKTLSS